MAAYSDIDAACMGGFMSQSSNHCFERGYAGRDADDRAHSISTPHDSGSDEGLNSCPKDSYLFGPPVVLTKDNSVFVELIVARRIAWQALAARSHG
jgi:hypothetical protein